MKVQHWLAGLAAMAALLGASPSAPVHVAPLVIPPVIRFRVIANSDNPLDQAVKLEVRDRVLQTLDPYLNGVKSRAAAQTSILKLEGRIKREANQVLRLDHARYRAQVAFTRTLFPTKAYGTWVLPAGRYEALLITLGKGQGHNWWCVLYPSLCFVDMGNALAVPTSSTLAPAGLKKDRHLSGRLQVSWQAPRFITTLLALLRH